MKFITVKLFGAIVTFSLASQCWAADPHEILKDRLFKFIGDDAIQCGSYQHGSYPPQLSEKEIQEISMCMTTAHRQNKAFYLSFEGAGDDSYEAYGILSLSKTGEIYRFKYDSDPGGGGGAGNNGKEAFRVSLCHIKENSGIIDPQATCKMKFRAPTALPTESKAKSHPQPCNFPSSTLPSDFVVLGAGAHSGRQLGFQIDQSGHKATQIDLLVNSSKKPVILMLGAYEPTIWNVTWSTKTQIVGVVVSGYHRQAVAGLPPEVPILNSSHENNGACGYFYVTQDNLGTLNPLSRKLFGRPVEMVYLAKNGTVSVGEEAFPGMKILSSPTVKPESFYDANAPIAGPAGLEDSVKKGLLRKATQEDAESWATEVAINTKKKDVPPISGVGIPESKKLPIGTAYTVLKPFTYPAGLYGGNSAIFLIPKGVPMPKGDPGHSTVYDFNTLSCQGVLCNAR